MMFGSSLFPAIAMAIGMVRQLSLTALTLLAVSTSYITGMLSSVCTEWLVHTLSLGLSAS